MRNDVVILEGESKEKDELRMEKALLLFGIEGGEYR